MLVLYKTMSDGDNVMDIYDIKIKEMGNNNCHLHAEDTVIHITIPNLSQLR